jgi:hypothetical protein
MSTEHRGRLYDRKNEKEMKEGAYASVCLETQLLVQPKHPGRRTPTSLMTELKPKKRKRSALKTEEAQESP